MPPRGFLRPRGANRPTRRIQGEEDRHSYQYSTLTGELEAALRSAAFANDKGALASFAAAVTPLHWSNPAVAPAIASVMTVARALFEPGPAPAVCEDMRAWVSSGYRLLSSASRTYGDEQDNLFSPASSGLLASSPETLIKPYEDASDRAILRRREALPTLKLLDTISDPSTRRVHEELGIEEAKSDLDSETSLSKSKVIGHGRSHAGTPFAVEVDAGFGPQCGHIVSFALTLTTGEGFTTTTSSSSLRCLSGSKRPAARASVGCADGMVKVESTTLPQTRRVRLLLSSGGMIVSKVTLVPRRYGGPAGVYFQTLRGASIHPVSLSELAVDGTVLRTVALRTVSACPRRAAGKSVFRQLVVASTPSGAQFSISGYSVDNGGHRALRLSAEGDTFAGAIGEAATAQATGRSKAFTARLSFGCEPQPFAVVYGQLKKPGNTVLVATATTPLTPLTTLALPKALGAPGALAYAALDSLPTEVVVRSGSGATLFKENLLATSKSDGEYCEGYVEPVAQPSPGG